MRPQIPIETYEKVVDLGKGHKARELGSSGSRVRGGLANWRNRDCLADLLPDSFISPFEFSRVQIDFEELMQAKFDLVVRSGPGLFLKDSVPAEAKTVYAD